MPLPPASDADVLDAAAMAALHAASFDGAARWSCGSFERVLADPRCFVRALPDGMGFALGRAVAGEGELLTLAVDPAVRRRGHARTLLARFEAEATRLGAADLFLEVSEDNWPARGLYDSGGWTVVGRRPGYYAGIAALAMHKRMLAGEAIRPERR